MDVVEIELGFDSFHAQVIADHCSDEGIEGQLLVFDGTRYELGQAAAVPNRFICAKHDEIAARRVVADLYPDLVIAHEGWVQTSASTPRSRRTKLVAGVLAVLFVGPFVLGAVQLLSNVF